MNKIIKGKKYNTETAKEICKKTNYCGNGLPSSWVTLYRKKTGEFFIARVSSGMDCWDTWEGITPISIGRAKGFCEENMDADGYESVFGEVEE